jgi:hypothetical protein
LTTATITAKSSVKDDTRAVDTLILDAMLVEWSGGDDEQAKRIAFELKMIIFFGPDQTTEYRRTNPRARSMCHKGSKYAIRKDRHTKAFYKEIDAITAAIEASKQTEASVRGRRKARKHAERSGHPRYRTARS